jgi:hypothetical protein
MNDREAGRSGLLGFWIRSLVSVALMAVAVGAGMSSRCIAQDLSQQQIEYFEKRIRPLLVRHCYECHSGASNEVKGSLRLDSRDAARTGGESGPAVVPGRPDDSLLLAAVRHDGLEMPPGRKLADSEIRELSEWIAQGAFDPRDAPPDASQLAVDTFDAIYRDRREWWSLQPVAGTAPPSLSASEGLSEIDRFVVAKLREQQLDLAPVADRRTLARRAFFAIVGLPPTESQLDEILSDTAADSWDRLVDRLLSSPHFGERWARHWMDVVRYTDTYGYEWDMPAKGAWLYRDYLIRAFNEDVPFDQLIREQIAGDLLKTPRINQSLQINESLIGPMFYQMGEKRHGDSAEFNGIHQEMLDNKIDAFGKAFLATTLACARCHDHKLDAISQRDYYALGGMFMSARWITNTADLPERNASVRAKLEELKQNIQRLLAERWLQNVQSISVEHLQTLSSGATNRPMEDPLYAWETIQMAQTTGTGIAAGWAALRQLYFDEHQRRVAENRAHFELVVDFRDGIPDGWSVDGEGLRGIVPRGDFVVAMDGDKVVESIVLGGLCTNTLSPRMNGALRTPWTKSIGPGQLSFEVAGGDFAARRTIVDNAFLTERQQYLNDPFPKWQVVDGLSSQQDRNVYIEFATKTSNPNFPPRVGLGGACSEEQTVDPRSWFQISRVVKHVAPFSPKDELTRLLPLFDDDEGNVAPRTVDDVATRYKAVLMDTVVAWREHTSNDDQIHLLNWMLTTGVLKNDLGAGPQDSPLQDLVLQYRELESHLQEPMTVNGMADIDAAQDYRLNIRGDYDQLGDAIPHGPARLLVDICGEPDANSGIAENPQFEKRQPAPDHNRLELAELVASSSNPLTARVYVNRVWYWLFGAGLVTTTDDFGHAGERPSHPELLDFLARRFMDEGWSTKRLIREILLSRTWRQSQESVARALEVDPANRLLHHFPVLRLDAESLRDAMLTVSGRLDTTLYGPTSNPFRLAEDAQKRLFSGPLDGLGRRSIYTKITIMEPPRFLATFNQPAPKIPTGRRDVSNTPTQSLTLLNDPFVIGQAEAWASSLVTQPDASIESRVQSMFRKALSRDATSEELSRWADAARDFAESEQIPGSDQMISKSLWQTLAHAMFNTKEFLYIR